MTDLLAEYGYLFLALVIFAESTGVPVPGESLVMAAGMLSSDGQLDIFAVLFATWLGAILGDNVSYLVGRRYGRSAVIRWGHKVGLGAEKFAQVERTFRAYGFWVVLSARFIIILRQLNGFVAGTMRMSWPRFMLLNSISAMLWTGAYGLGAYAFGTALEHFLDSHSTLTILAIAISVSLVGFLGTYRVLFRSSGKDAEENIGQAERQPQ